MTMTEKTPMPFHEWMQSNPECIRIPLDIAQSKLSATAKLIWGYIAYRSGDNDHCRISDERIADDLEIPYETVIKELDILRKIGLMDEK
jgi:hypothetical protein